MTMKMFQLDDILLIGEVPDRLSSPEAQGLFEQIDKWFRCAAATTGHTRGGVHHFDEPMTSQTTKDS
jgi:hypothetical protein